MGQHLFYCLLRDYFVSVLGPWSTGATVAILLSWWTVSALLSSLLLYLAGYSTRLLHLLQQPYCFWDLVQIGVKIWEIIPKCFRYFLLKICRHPSLNSS